MELGIESGHQLTLASPALDFGFGRFSSLNDAVWDFASRVQSVSTEVSRQFVAAFAKRRGGFDGISGRDAVAPQQSVSQGCRPMSLADQWSRVTSVLVQSVDAARVATEMQSAATQQLDLAQYGLITLMDELSGVMTIPGRRTRSATVHAFNSAVENAEPLPPLGRAMAA